MKVDKSEKCSSFPEGYCKHVRTVKGVDILIRPLMETDLIMFKEFLNSLSQQTVYYRFFYPIREFSDELLNRLIRVDQKSHIALAAFSQENYEERILGVSRLFIKEDLSSSEVSVVIADSWQGKGIGAELFSRCLDIGKSMGVRRIWGYVLPENTQMLKLAKNLKFEVKHVEDSHEFLVSLDCTID